MTYSGLNLQKLSYTTSETAHVQYLPPFKYIGEFVDLLEKQNKKLYLPVLDYVYAELNTSLRQQVSEITNLTHTVEIIIPPISAIILSRASTLADIPNITLEIRAKFSRLRKVFREYENSLRDVSRPLSYRIKILRDIELISKELSKPYDHIDAIYVSEWADIWSLFQDVLEGDFSPAKITGKLLGKPLEYMIKRFRLRNVYYLFNLRRKALSTPSNQKLIAKFFDDPINIDLLSDLLETNNKVARLKSLTSLKAG